MKNKTMVLVVVYILFLMVMLGVLVFDMKNLYDDLHRYEVKIEVLEQEVKDLETDKRELIEKIEGLDDDKMQLAEKVNYYLTERDQMVISEEVGGYAE